MPDRSDYYLMGLTREVRYRGSKTKPRPPTRENLKAEFGLNLAPAAKAEKRGLTPADRERLTIESRSRWLGAVGGPRGNVVGDPRKKREE